jgi:hypothetical protein
MVQFSLRNIDVSKSYGQNATDQLTHQSPTELLHPSITTACRDAAIGDSVLLQ